MTAGPSVVALGGGHGLAATLRAVRRYAGEVTAVVSVADDGGSSGRLRRERGVPPPGDLRKCLVALADEGNTWASALEFRFDGGTLGGHALGNLVIAALAEVTGDFARAVDQVGELVGAVGRVLPATVEPVVLKASVDGRPVEGQVAVAHSRGRVESVEIVPTDARPPGEVLDAVAAADQVVIAPGSLFTSVLPVVCVRDLRRAVAAARGRVVQVCNLLPQIPETEGLTGTDHVRALFAHGLERVDVLLYDPDAPLEVDASEVAALGVEPVGAPLVDHALGGHDAERLAAALSPLL